MQWYQIDRNCFSIKHLGVLALINQSPLSQLMEHSYKHREHSHSKVHRPLVPKVPQECAPQAGQFVHALVSIFSKHHNCHVFASIPDELGHKYLCTLEF